MPAVEEKFDEPEFKHNRKSIVGRKLPIIGMYPEFYNVLAFQIVSKTWKAAIGNSDNVWIQLFFENLLCVSNMGMRFTLNILLAVSKIGNCMAIVGNLLSILSP